MTLGLTMGKESIVRTGALIVTGGRLIVSFQSVDSFDNNLVLPQKQVRSPVQEVGN